jgi:hypothetical protein
MSSRGELSQAEAIQTRRKAAVFGPDGLRRQLARIQSAKAVAIILFWSPTRRARLLRPITALAIGGFAFAALLVRAFAFVVREGLYRNVVVLPLEYRSTDAMIWGFSDPLDTSPIGAWLAHTPHFRTHSDLRFQSAKLADYCSSEIPGSFRI